MSLDTELSKFEEQVRTFTIAGAQGSFQHGFVISGQGKVADTGEGAGGDGGDVLGCTDSLASNYDPAATVDDGSCVYAGPCGCIKTIAVDVVSTVTVTREGDPFMSMETSFSHTFIPGDSDGFCVSEFTDFNTCIDGCFNDGRYADPDAPVFAGEGIFMRRYCDDGFIEVIIDVCNICIDPADPCDSEMSSCVSDNIGGAFDYDALVDGSNMFDEHYDNTFTAGDGFEYVQNRDTTITITVT